MTNLQNPPDRTQQTFQLPDGRLLRYHEYCLPQGWPLVFFHGWPSARDEFGGLDGEAIASNLNLGEAAMVISYRPRHLSKKPVTELPAHRVEKAENLELARI